LRAVDDLLEVALRLRIELRLSAKLLDSTLCYCNQVRRMSDYQ